MRVFVLFLLLSITRSYLIAQPLGYAYGRTITIDAGEIPGSGSLTDFPVLISLDENYLRTTNFTAGNPDGRLSSPDGYDVVFYTDDCLTQLDHQVERYVANSGIYIAWVRIPILSATTNTVIHMYYGNPSAGNTSTSDVWDSNYRGVWHFNNTVNDATVNLNHLTDNASNSSTTQNTQIGQGRQLNNGANINSNTTNGEYLRLPNGFFSGMNNFTFESWVFLDRIDTNWERIFDFGQSTDDNFFFTPSTGTDDDEDDTQTRARITINGAGSEQGAIIDNDNDDMTDVWIHWAVVLNDATNTMSVYRNGVLYGATGGVVTLLPSSIESSTANYFGRSQYGADHYLDASIDEFRISTTARSAQWIQTSYNNQDDPTDFYSVGIEQAASALCAPLPITLSVFNAIPEGDNVKLLWATSTETNNNYFTIERSRDGRTFELVDTVSGAGNSSTKKDYTLIDTNPFWGRSYYRLTQRDYDGTQKSFPLVSVEIERGEFSFSIYPNPTDGELNIDLLNVEDDKEVSISVADLQGKQIIAEVSIPSGDKVKSSIQVSAQQLLPGIYLVKIRHGEQVFVRKLVIE